MESGPHFEQAGNAAAYSDAPFGRLRDSAQDLEKGRLSSPVAANDADKFALVDFEIDVAQRPKLLSSGPSAQRSKPLRWLPHGAVEGVPQAVAFGRLVPDEIPLGDVLAGNDRITHMLDGRRLNSTRFHTPINVAI